MRSGTWAILTAGAVLACSSSLDAQGDSAGPSGNDGSFAGSTGIGGATSAAGSSSLPPEQEEGQSYRAPVVSGRWVWTANPDTGKVAVVDAKSFAVRLADAGAGPTYLTALPTSANSSRALVINVASHDATLLGASATGPVSATGPIPLQADANAWAVSKTGQFALAWTDSQNTSPDPTQGYQDVSVVDLRGKEPRATRLVVGFLPTRVFIDDAEQKAFVVASSGISIIDLVAAGGPRVVSELPVSSDLHEDAKTRDVSVVPDGSFALVRHEGSAAITSVDLATGALSTITLSGPVTDLDLVTGAKSALAVVRGGAPPPVDDGSAGAGGDSGESGAGGMGGEGGAEIAPEPNGQSTLAILPIPGIFSAPGRFDTVSLDELFGLVNIAPEGTAALLYTNAVPSTHLTVLETAPGARYLSHRTVDLRGNVDAVFPSPDGAYAIASLKPRDATGKPGFAAVPIDRALPPRVQTTDAPLFAVAQSSGDAPRAVVTVSDNLAKFSAYIVRLPELTIDQVTLPSRPLPGATGLVPEAGMAYIAQAHPQGRITFINLETGVPRTITGFELASRVVDGK